MNNFGRPSDSLSQDSFRGNGQAIAKAKNKVLSQTYVLLAISIAVAALGALVGMQFNIFAGMRPFMQFAIFMIGVYGLMFLVVKNRNSAAGVGFLLAFTFFMGLTLSNLISSILMLANGPSLILYAFGSTATIFFIMATLANVIKKDLSFISKFLFIGLIACIIGAVANIFLLIPALSLALATVVVIICSLYLLVDVQRIINGGETNYIMATMSIFISLYNIFSSLLSIFGITSSSD
ncbi:Bax inhibitor-1/YccA family protein [Taylorella equigenitalis]|uniref:Bax inhibitor-1/YccA family protein n=1 Tax=Taylorella equigenitalis TaxID=29575 RepID=UPI0003F9BBCC|nr:Bax inhibitor-1/YccA family protein [Taylorella equigenitalis]